MITDSSKDMLIKQQIENASHFWVTSHIRPDGDAVEVCLVLPTP